MSKTQTARTKGYTFLIIVAIMYVLSSVLIKEMAASASLITISQIVLSGIYLIPVLIRYVHLSRSNLPPSQIAQKKREFKKKEYQNWIDAMPLTFFWIASQFLFNFGLKEISTSTSSVISSLSCFVTYTISVLTGKKAVRFHSILSMLITLCAAVLPLILFNIRPAGDDSDENPTSFKGVLCTFLSSVSYSLFGFFLEKKYPNEEELDMDSLLGYIALNTLLASPLIFSLLLYAGMPCFAGVSWECVGWLLINGLVFSALPHYLISVAFVLISPLAVTLGLNLCVPISLVVEYVAAPWIKNGEIQKLSGVFVWFGKTWPVSPYWVKSIQAMVVIFGITYFALYQRKEDREKEKKEADALLAE